MDHVVQDFSITFVLFSIDITKDILTASFQSLASLETGLVEASLEVDRIQSAQSLGISVFVFLNIVSIITILLFQIKLQTIFREFRLDLRIVLQHRLAKWHRNRPGTAISTSQHFSIFS